MSHWVYLPDYDDGFCNTFHFCVFSTGYVAVMSYFNYILKRDLGAILYNIKNELQQLMHCLFAHVELLMPLTKRIMQIR